MTIDLINLRRIAIMYGLKGDITRSEYDNIFIQEYNGNHKNIKMALKEILKKRGEYIPRIYTCCLCGEELIEGDQCDLFQDGSVIICHDDYPTW